MMLHESTELFRKSFGSLLILALGLASRKRDKKSRKQKMGLSQ